MEDYDSIRAVVETGRALDAAAPPTAQILPLTARIDAVTFLDADRALVLHATIARGGGEFIGPRYGLVIRQDSRWLVSRSMACGLLERFASLQCPER